MTPMRPMFTLLALAAAAMTPACDPEADTCEAPIDAAGSLHVVQPVQLEQDDDAISLREQGPPQGLYTSTLGGKPIYRKQFVAMINACQKQVDPPLTCTLSWYQPDVTKDERVLGIGCSMLAPTSLLGCWGDIWLANNAVAF
ncbi:MAG: hypothetical protein VW516_00060 [Rhodospirillaceae bacterium]|jgi:hypothetical protein